MRKKQNLGFWSLTALVAGNMIGSGVFLLPSALARLGTLSLLSWVITSIGAMVLALVFVRLSNKIKKAGGPYAYTRFAFGDFIGFQTAYSYWLNVWIGNAAIATAMAGYCSAIFPTLDNPVWHCVLSISAIWLFTGINILGVRFAGQTQFVLLILKLIPLLMIAIFGWFYIHPSYYHIYFQMDPKLSHTHVLLSGSVLTMWAFVGLESATVPTDDIGSDRSVVLKATIVGVSIAAIIYIACSSVTMGIIPAPKLANSEFPFALAAMQIFGPWGKIIASLGAILSCLGCLNGWILLQGQIGTAAAKDNLFPKLFKKVDKNGTPVGAILITSVLVSVLLLLTSSKDLVTQFQVIILMAALTALLPYFYTAAAGLLIHEFKKSAWVDLSLCSIALMYSLFAIIGAGDAILSATLILLLLGVPIYVWIKKSA